MACFPKLLHGRLILPGLMADGLWGGVLSLEMGTDLGPTAADLWLWQANIARKEGLSSHCECA